MGVRYNAEKTKVGMYHSTPVYKFSMPCHLCAGRIVMQTDPQNFDYIILEGARRKMQKWDPEENEQIVFADYAEKKKLALDSMYHLEHNVQDKHKAVDVAPVLNQLETDRQSYKDDFTLNQIARKHFREAKRLALEESGKDRSLLNRLSLTGSEVRLLPEVNEDSRTAKMLRLSQVNKESSKSTADPQPSVDTAAVFASHPIKSASSLKKPEIKTSSASSSGGTTDSSTSTSSAKELATAVASSKRTSYLLQQRGQAFINGNHASTTCSSTALLLSTGIRIVPLPAQKKVESSLAQGLVSYGDSDESDSNP